MTIRPYIYLSIYIFLILRKYYLYYALVEFIVVALSVCPSNYPTKAKIDGQSERHGRFSKFDEKVASQPTVVVVRAVWTVASRS